MNRERLDGTTVALLLMPPAFWAGNAVLARMLVGEVPPMLLSWLRWAVALALLLPFAWASLVVHRDVIRRDWPSVLLIGALGVGAYNTLQYLALQTATPLSTTLIASSSPAFILAVGLLAFGERAGVWPWLGGALSIAGVLLVMAKGDPANLASLQFVPGDLIMLAANLTWAVYTWLLRKRRPAIPFLPFLTAQVIVGLVAITPFAAVEFAVTPAPVTWSPKAAAIVLYMALLPSIAAYFCWDHGVRRAGAVIPVVFANLTPVFAGVLSLWLLGDLPRWYHGVALAAIVAGIHLANRRR